MLSVVVDGLIEVVGDDDDGGILLIGIEKETFSVIPQHTYLLCFHREEIWDWMGEGILFHNNSIPFIPFNCVTSPISSLFPVSLMATDKALLRYPRNPTLALPLRLILPPTIPPTPHQFSTMRPPISSSHNFRVQVLVARGRSEWFVRVVVSAAVLAGLTPTVMVAAPAPTWPSIPMTAQARRGQ
jgi:hypothetical protein